MLSIYYYFIFMWNELFNCLYIANCYFAIIIIIIIIGACIHPWWFYLWAMGQYTDDYSIEYCNLIVHWIL